MTFFLWIVGVLAVIYCTFILLYNHWWQKLSVFPPAERPENGDTPTFFSVIIAARNEEAYIADCVKSILKGSYPASYFEIIIVDDFSTDQSIKIIEDLQAVHANVKLLSLKKMLGNRPINSYKKKAIELAIAESAGTYIVTTDADCQVPQHWLTSFNGYIRRTGKRFIAAPVRFVDDKTFLGRFQCLDFLSLQGVTAASVGAGFLSMCNGANLCYEKKLFYEVGGFTGIAKLASGDDMLLMHKIQKDYPSSIGFLFTNEAVVDTWPMPGWTSFINQRIRWASKADNYQDWKIKAVLLCVYLWNLGLLALFVIGFFQPVMWCWWLAFIVTKFLVEGMFMRRIARFFGQSHLLRLFLWMQPFHILYTVVAGFLGLFGSYSWKDRKVQ